jgi:hypothetical protein
MTKWWVSTVSSWLARAVGPCLSVFATVCIHFLEGVVALCGWRCQHWSWDRTFVANGTIDLAFGVGFISVFAGSKTSESAHNLHLCMFSNNLLLTHPFYCDFRLKHPLPTNPTSQTPFLLESVSDQEGGYAQATVSSFSDEDSGPKEVRTRRPNTSKTHPARRSTTCKSRSGSELKPRHLEPHSSRTSTSNVLISTTIQWPHEKRKAVLLKWSG